MLENLKFAAVAGAGTTKVGKAGAEAGAAKIGKAGAEAGATKVGKAGAEAGAAKIGKAGAAPQHWFAGSDTKRHFSQNTLS